MYTSSLPPIFQASNINKIIDNKKILHNVSIEIAPGELKILIGPSGAGKSTFLQCLNYLIKPDSGEIFLDQKKIDPSKKQNLYYLRRQVGMIFQDFNLFDHLTAEKNIAIALHKVAGYSWKDAQQRALQELSRVGLADKATLYPAQFSGGQKQRIAIARALAMDPKVLLLDEPTSALDPERKGEVLQVIQNLAHNGMTMIMTTHQMDFVLRLATEILFMEHGVIIEQGPPKELLNSSKRVNDFCRHLNTTITHENNHVVHPSVSSLLAGDLSHDITSDNTESLIFPKENKE